MDRLLIVATAIPFAVLIIGIILLVSVRHSIGGGYLTVSIMFIPIRRIPLADIDSVEFNPPHSTKRIGVFSNPGTVTVIYGEPETSVTLTPSDPKRLAEELIETLGLSVVGDGK
jgi:hypothetical protein